MTADEFVFEITRVLEGATQLEHTIVLLYIFIKVNCELFIAFDVQTLVHCDFHPGWLKAVTLDGIRDLVSFRGLFSIGVFFVDCDPALMLAKQTISNCLLFCLVCPLQGLLWTINIH